MASIAPGDGNGLQPWQQRLQLLSSCSSWHLGAEGRAACPNQSHRSHLWRVRTNVFSILVTNKPPHVQHPAAAAVPSSGTSALVQWHRQRKEFFLNSSLTLAAELSALCSMRLDHTVHYLIFLSYITNGLKISQAFCKNPPTQLGPLTQ